MAMQSFTCPHCGRKGTTKQQVQPGRKARCPGCHEFFSLIPDDQEEAIYEVADVPPPLPDKDQPDSWTQPVANVPSVATVAPAGDGVATAPLVATAGALPQELEPWFYRHLWRYGSYLKATVNIVVGLILVLMILASIGLLVSEGASAFLTVVGVWVIGLLFLAMYRFFALLHAAKVLLAVDLARNIRRQRQLEEARA
jgi:hypothetical protein